MCVCVGEWKRFHFFLYIFDVLSVILILFCVYFSEACNSYLYCVDYIAFPLSCILHCSNVCILCYCFCKEVLVSTM